MKDDIGNDLIPGPGKYFLDNSYFLKDGEKTSFFFKKSIPKSDNPIEKYLNIPKIESFKIPGPGEYNLRKELIKKESITIDVNKKKPFLSSNDKSVIDTQHSEIVETLNFERTNQRMIYPGGASGDNKRGIKSVFMSKSPKEDYIKQNHIPGPCYYNPKEIPYKINYNLNTDKIWL